MLKAYFFFIKHYYFTISVFLLTQLHLCSEMVRNGRKGEVDENGESGENRNSGKNLPQFWRIFKLDGKRGSLESEKKKANLAKSRQKVDEN